MKVAIITGASQGSAPGWSPGFATRGERLEVTTLQARGEALVRSLATAGADSGRSPAGA
jgi:hypothetical protein